jgi:hypothetical protein
LIASFHQENILLAGSDRFVSDEPGSAKKRRQPAAANIAILPRFFIQHLTLWKRPTFSQSVSAP